MSLLPALPPPSSGGDHVPPSASSAMPSPQQLPTLYTHTHTMLARRHALPFGTRDHHGGESRGDKATTCAAAATTTTGKTDVVRDAPVPRAKKAPLIQIITRRGRYATRTQASKGGGTRR